MILQGGGEHARVVLDCLLAQGATVLALFDPKYSGTLFGVPQRGAYDRSFHPNALALVAIGDNGVRKRVVQNTVHGFTSAVHPSVIFSPFAELGAGSMILHGAIVQAQARIGNHVIVNTGARVDHDCVIGDYVHLAPGVILCGTVQIGEGAFIGAGATIIPGKKVGAWATVGAGAVVIEDVPDYGVAVGNPARVIKINKP
ncbi:acetyltransferase [Chryseolinea sp. Jin1]|uniref:Acetyltransferase n=1 Tax=Chryseolinea lacunae TaxID=2801331 RepID=A0ABS1KX77_9BACT|nr:acetyltransferase [Chryseolinea lacunae]